jgi:glycosyltransferase involved in cell wall biosynthesis
MSEAPSPITGIPTAFPGSRAARPAISCVVPAFNESQNLPLLLPRLQQTLRGLTDAWEVIVVDDGSRDATVAVLAPWLGSEGVVCVALSRNFGKEAALGAGLDHARGEVVITLDADLQHPVELFPRMLEAWRGGADMVYAVRADRSDESAAKRIGTRAFYALLHMGSSVRIPPNAGDFRLMDRRVVDAICALPERTRFMKGLYAWVGFRTQAIEFAPPPRLAGSSGFGLRALFSLAASGITAFSNLPLRVASFVGTLLAFAAMGYGAWVLIDHFLHGNDVAGWATIVVGLMFFSGVQLLFIGILGEYLGRVYDEVKLRPRYVVAHLLGESPLSRTPYGRGGGGEGVGKQ